MAHVAPIYPNFARGEVSPLMFGRIDIEQYPTCLEKCRNAYIRPYGCVTRLSGTEFISNAKNNGKARLLKFVFSPTDSYIIECGAGYFRFYQNGALVLKDSSNVSAWATSTNYKIGDYVIENDVMYYCIKAHTSGTFADDLTAKDWVAQDIYELPNEYSEEQLPSIQYVQIDDIIKLTCLPDTRGNTSAKPKELLRHASDDWTFRDVEFKETPYLDQNTTSITMTPSAVTGNITIQSSADYFNANMVGANMWLGTKVKDTDTNKDVQGFVKITGYTDARNISATVKSKLSGTSATKLWGMGAFSDDSGYPSVVALFDGRLYYARTPVQPRNVYGSKPYAYETFTPAVDNEDDAGINVALATNANGDGSDIKWMIGGSYLLLGTYGGEFVIRGTGDGAITPTDISARQRTNWGGEPVQPIVAGTFVHFLQRNGNKLRQFQYDFYYDAYKAVDVSIFSEHLLESPIKEMALQKNPDSIIYLMREDGKVVMLTLEQDQSIQAWSLLEELGAEVESIQTIPSYDGNYDEVYMLMKRRALQTVLTPACSNPLVTVTDNYTGTKETEGTEVITLTYSGYYGIWQNSESQELFTKLFLYPNVGFSATTTYSSVKASAGTINETLEYTQMSYYEVNEHLTAYGNPVFNQETGIVNLSNGLYVFDSAKDLMVIKFTTGNTIQNQDIINSFNSGNGYIGITGAGEVGNLVIKNTKGQSWSTIIYPNTTYWLKQKFLVNAVEIGLSTDGLNFETIATFSNDPVFPSAIKIFTLGGDGDGFKGTIDLVNTLVEPMLPDEHYTTLAAYAKRWVSQTSGQVIDLNADNYKITISGYPPIGSTLLCQWVTTAGYVTPEQYNLTITGTPVNGDTITLTYDTTYSTVVRYIERMQNPITPLNQNDWWYVRSGLKYDGFKLTEGNNLTLSANSGEVTAQTDNAIFTAGMVGNRIRFIDDDYNILGEGEITAFTDSTHVTLNITTYFQSKTISGGKWGISTDVVSGLSHLNGRTVQVYADCVEQEEKTVINGSIDIDDAFIAVVGLPYQSYIKTMPMEAGSQNGTAVGKRKRISEMAIRVWNSLGVRVGRDLDNLYQTIYKQTEPFTGVIPNIKYNQGWVWDANITVEQSHPYPMNILSIAPIVTEVDK